MCMWLNVHVDGVSLLGTITNFHQNVVGVIVHMPEGNTSGEVSCTCKLL